MQQSRCNLLVFRWLLAACLLLFAPFTALADGNLVNIRFGVYPDKTRVVLDLSGAAGYAIEPQTQPDRIVVDLRDASINLPAGGAPSGRGLVKAIQIDETAAGDARLVFALSAPARVGRAQFLAASDSAPPRIFLDLQPGAALPSAAVPQPVPAQDGRQNAKGTSEAAAAVAARPPNPDDQAPVAQVASAGTGPSPALDDAWRLIPPVKPERPATAADPVPMSLVAMTVPTGPPPAKQSGRDRRSLPLIVLDAGHGGKDPGATGPHGSMEKDITLQMAKDLRGLLESTGRYRVLLTREDDTLLALRERIEIARAAGADLFISLHTDHNDNVKLRGASVYTLSETASDAEADALAARENKEDVITGVDLSNQSAMVTSILIDLAQRETKNLSARLASLLTDALADHTLVLRNSHRFAGFAVLKAPDVPSVLVELGYLSNEDDEAALVSASHRARLAKAMLESIDRYFQWQRSVRAS